ncbi:MAG: hypothetical protein P1P89_08685 [Desulfobacterales bacterium]|nr:hypothetical protein [Desulfobacterales bacterium]
MRKNRLIHYLFIIISATMISTSMFDRNQAWGNENAFAGFWQSENGSIVQVYGDKGVLKDTAFEPWKKFINQTTIKNIRPLDAHWTADEWLINAGVTFWAHAIWRLSDNKISRFINVNGKIIETYFVKINIASLPQHLSGNEKLSFTATPSSGSSSPHSFEIAPVVFRFEYEEPSLMSEKGFLYGIMGRYAYNHKAVMIDSSLEYAAGSLDYDGSTWGGTPVKADTDDYLFEIRTLLGGNIYQGKNKVTPFLGFGLRYWNDTIQGSGGYAREILYLYTPIGFKLTGPVSSKWSWGFSGEYDLFWKGWVTSHLSDADPGYNDPENTQSFGDGFGVRISFQFRNHISTRLSWYIEPFFRYWDVGPSDYAILTYYGAPTGLFVYEPENNTLTYGVTFGFGF